MELKLATVDDFAFCKELYDDIEADMIYRQNLAEEKNDSSIGDFFDEETFAFLERETELTQKKYERSLTEETERTFILYDKTERIGFFYLSLTYPNKPSSRNDIANRWTLANMCLRKEAQTTENFTIAIELLLEEQYIDVVDVFCITDDQIQDFLDAGFRRWSVSLRKEQSE